MAYHDVFRMKVVYIADEQTCTTTLFYKETLYGSGSNDENQLITQWVNHVKPKFLDAVAATTKLSHLTVQRVSPTAGIPHMAIFDESADVGTRSGDALPSNVCAIYNLGNAASGAHHGGRLFLSGISESDTDGQWLSGAVLGQPLYDLAFELQQILVDSGMNFTLCVRETQDALTPVDPPVYNEVTIVVPGARVGNLRKRTSREQYVP